MPVWGSMRRQDVAAILGQFGALLCGKMWPPPPLYASLMLQEAAKCGCPFLCQFGAYCAATCRRYFGAVWLVMRQDVAALVCPIMFLSLIYLQFIISLSQTLLKAKVLLVRQVLAAIVLPVCFQVLNPMGHNVSVKFHDVVSLFSLTQFKKFKQ